MDKLQAFLSRQYDMNAKALVSMDGYDSTNFQIESGGDRRVLKLYAPEPGLLELLDAENQLLHHLNQSIPGKFPFPIRDIQERGLGQFEDKTVRLLSFLEGTFFAEAAHTPTLFQNFGRFLAEMDHVLSSFRHTAIEARRHHWDLARAQENESLTDYLSPDRRKLAQYFFQQFREQVLPVIHTLRHQVIHSDANDWNVLTDGEEICGLIDFGDMAYAPLVNELAIAITYAVFDKASPLEWAGYLVEGYHSVLPLSGQELELLYWLVGARLAVSVSRSAYTARQKPDSDYITVSEAPAWTLMEQWLAINPGAAARQFQLAAGMQPERSYEPSADLHRRHRSISKALSVTFAEPVYMERAAFQYMYDRTGRTYLDAYNNIPHVGHNHPHVVAAGQRQMARLNTNTRYLYDLLPTYAERLLATFPEHLNRIFFVNSGSAASDLAIRLAMTHTGLRDLLIMEHGYHGHTRQGIDISSYKFEGKGGSGQQTHIFKAPLPDMYKGAFAGMAAAGTKYAQQAIHELEVAGQVAAFITEPVVGCGGQVPLAPGYLPLIYEAVRARGGVCISDEVQTGFGRLGDWFWGFEQYTVVPDIVVMGKPMGNGHPMAAVVTTEAIAHSFENGMEFFSSFGGNPVSCAIGMAVMEVLQKEALQAHARQTGAYWLERLRALQTQHHLIGDVRGSGFFLGVELVEDPALKTPYTSLAKYLKEALKRRGILVGTDGPADNVLKIKPPMCFSRENVDVFMEALGSELGSFPIIR